MKLLRNRRGVALESALLFLIVLFSLCSLLMTVAVVGRYQVKIENTAIVNRAALDQVGEDFVLGNITAGGTKTVEIDDRELTLYYTVTSDGESTHQILKVWYGSSSDGDPALTVTVGENKIQSWVYG